MTIADSAALRVPDIHDALARGESGAANLRQPSNTAHPVAALCFCREATTEARLHTLATYIDSCAPSAQPREFEGLPSSPHLHGSTTGPPARRRTYGGRLPFFPLARLVSKRPPERRIFRIHAASEP